MQLQPKLEQFSTSLHNPLVGPKVLEIAKSQSSHQSIILFTAYNIWGGCSTFLSFGVFLHRTEKKNCV